MHHSVRRDIRASRLEIDKGDRPFVLKPTTAIARFHVLCHAPAAGHGRLLKLVEMLGSVSEAADLPYYFNAITFLYSFFRCSSDMSTIGSYMNEFK